MRELPKALGAIKATFKQPNSKTRGPIDIGKGKRYSPPQPFCVVRSSSEEWLETIQKKEKKRGAAILLRDGSAQVL
jgi:hypothetical protein